MYLSLIFTQESRDLKQGPTEPLGALKPMLIILAKKVIFLEVRGEGGKGQDTKKKELILIFFYFVLNPK